MNEEGKKRWRPSVRAAAAIVICLALILGSGFAGAKIAEWRLEPPQGGYETSLAHIPGDNIFGGSGGGDSYSGSGGSGDSYSDSGSGDSYSGSGDSYSGSGDSYSDSGSDSYSGSNDDHAKSANPLGGINPNGETLTLTELFAGANPAVVAISTEMTGRNAFGRVVTQPAAGSGFIISSDGYIVTNNHVIENATSISVLLHDGTNHPATLVGRDPETDLAVLKIEADNLSYLTWGNSDALQVGEQVAAIGNPLGEFANSMTVGYISALDREINIDGVPRNMLQTDAAVNSGNSGGPLLNLKGQVIGIVTAKSSGMDVEGLGFALPSSKVTGIVEQLIRDGYVTGRAVLGVMVGTNQDDDRANVYVVSVNDGSAADKAGILAEDIILSANGKAVSTVEELKEIIGELSPGDKLVLKIQRGDEELSLTAVLDEYKPPETADPVPFSGQAPSFPDEDFSSPFGPWGAFPDMGGMMPGGDGN